MEYEGERWVQGAEAQAVEVEVKAKAREVQEVKVNALEVELLGCGNHAYSSWQELVPELP